MRELLRTGAGATLVLLIMVIGSLVLWIGTPLLWLWVGSQVQGATSSLGTALGVAFIGVVATIGLIAAVLAKLSDVYRANRLPRARRHRALRARGRAGRERRRDAGGVRRLVLLLRRREPRAGRNPDLRPAGAGSPRGRRATGRAAAGRDGSDLTTR